MACFSGANEIGAGIGKDALNGLLVHGVNVSRQLGFAKLFRQIQCLLSDVTIHHIPSLGVRSALLPARTASVDFRGTAVEPFTLFVGGGMPEDCAS